MSKVLVTGGSGFVASHCIVQLLESGHKVQTTIRNPKRENEVRDMVKNGGIVDQSNLSFYIADLESDIGWKQAIVGCDYILHVASPFPSGQPKDENELIRPAVDGAVRVLKYARDLGVKRVVMTSSFAAIGYGLPRQDKPFDEKNWTDVQHSNVPAYHKSKALAERAAWDFIKNEGGKLELTVINPVGIFGPVLGPDLSSSIAIVKGMLEGAMPAVPKVYFGVVDVRDVAKLHIQAMTLLEAKNERFLASSGDCNSMFEVAQSLKKGLGDKANKAPRFELPNWLARLLAKVKPEMQGVLPELGNKRHLDNQKSRRVFNWNPISSSDAVVATAESLEKLKLLSVGSK